MQVQLNGNREDDVTGRGEAADGRDQRAELVFRGDVRDLQRADERRTRANRAAEFDLM